MEESVETGVVPKDSMSSSDTGSEEPSTVQQQLQAAHDLQVKKLNQHIEQVQEDNFSLSTQVMSWIFLNLMQFKDVWCSKKISVKKHTQV